MEAIVSRSLRALLVEDEFMIALLLESYMKDCGVSEVVVVPTLARGLAAAREGDFDLAILDVNLNGESSFPIAQVLSERRIPFSFSTGYGPEGVARQFPDRPVLTKPYSPAVLKVVLRQLLDDPPADPQV